MCNYHTISEYNQKKFGERIQKIAIDAGFTCPNRDGTISCSGCLYCNNDTFSPFYADKNCSISEQLEKGVKFYKNRYKCNRFLAYFQSFTNTYAPVQKLLTKYNEALSNSNIEGIIIGTRPDCINKEITELLKDLSRKTYIRIELGIESFDDEVLNAINRGHNVNDSIKAISMLNNAEIDTGVHLIFGLPEEKENCEETAAEIINDLNIKFVKLHHLQIVKGSTLAYLYENKKIALKLHTLDSYINSVFKFLTVLKENVYIERFINRVPTNMLIAPKWGNIDETAFRKLLDDKFRVCQL